MGRLKVVLLEPEIQTHVFADGRDTEGGQGGNTVVPVVVMNDRGLPCRPPRPSAGRNEQKAAFIEENQVGPKSLRLFLYAAICSASNGQWPLRSAGSLGARVPGRTSPRGATAAIGGWGGIQYRTRCGSPALSASASTARWENHRPRLLPTRGPEAAGVRLLAASADGPEPVWPSEPQGRPGLPPVAIGRPRKMRPRHAARPPSDSYHARAVLWLVADAVPTPSGFQWVSCIIDRLSACITFAKRYKGRVSHYEHRLCGHTESDGSLCRAVVCDPHHRSGKQLLGNDCRAGNRGPHLGLL